VKLFHFPAGGRFALDKAPAYIIAQVLGGEAERNGGIEMPTRNMADGEGHRQHRKAYRESDGNKTCGWRGKKPRAADRGYKRESADELGAQIF